MLFAIAVLIFGDFIWWAVYSAQKIYVW